MCSGYGLFPFLVAVMGAAEFAAAATADPRIICSKTSELVTSCGVTFPDRLVVYGGSVYVGVEDKLVRFSLELGSVHSVVDRPASNKAINLCKRFRQPHCANYVLTMLVTNLTGSGAVMTAEHTQFVNKTVLFICSTFGFSPQCELCDVENISHCVNTSQELKLGYSPYDRRFNNVYTLTKDRVFYTGSSFDDKNGLQAVAKFPSPFNGSKFTLHTYTSETWRWLHNPTFISLYEVDQYIYFFWREEAFEADQRVYTRVGRVCKSDRGIGGNSTTLPSVFSTFVKARVICSVPQDGNNRYPFEYNELQATQLVTNGNSHTLYGVFSTPSNGPASSAICTYTFTNDENSLSTAFNGDYLFADSSSDPWSPISNPSPFDCPGNGPNQRSTQDAERYLLMEDPVHQSTPFPVHTEVGAYITAVVVDSTQWNGQVVDVIHIGLSNGVVKQVIQNISEVTLYTTPSSSPVKKLVLYKSNGVKYCYITSDDNIAVVQLGHCAHYNTCSQCIHDVYCRWNEHSCTDDVNIAANVTCPTIDPVPVPTTIVTNQVHVTTVYRTNVQTVIADCSTPAVVKEPAAVSNLNDKNCKDLPIILGATVGGVVLGIIIGAVVFVTVYLIKRSNVKKPVMCSQGKEYDEDPFDSSPSANQSQKHHFTQPANGRIDTANMPTGQMARARTESTKRLISISSELYPDSPSPPNTLQCQRRVE